MAGPPPQLLGTVLQGTYKVERLIGEGGMGFVFEASHLRLPRRFAIKVLAGAVARDAEALARFRREAEITSELGHPHIVEVVDFNTTDDGSPYLVMELLQGEALDQRLTRQGKLPLEGVRSILEQAASALHAAHERGVVHRDLKPPNIFLQRGPAGEQVKLLDFGISKVLGSTSLMTGAFTLIGTPNYMSPEQAQGHNAEVDARTDVFAMGAILYEMIAGRPAFVGENVPSILFQVVHQDPVPITGLRPDLPADAAAAIARALSKHRDQRQASIAQLAAEFAAAQASPLAARLASESRNHTLAAVPAPPLATERPGAGVASRPIGTTISGGAGEVRSLSEPLPHQRRWLIGLAAGLVGLAGGVGLYLGVLRPVPGTGSGSGSVAARPPARERADARSRIDASSRVDARRRIVDASTRAAPDAARPGDLTRRVHAHEGFGWLRVGMSGWAKTSLDGKPVGDAPFARMKVATGVHQLKFWLGLRTVTKAVTIEPGRTTVLRVDMTKLKVDVIRR